MVAIPRELPAAESESSTGTHEYRRFQHLVAQSRRRAYSLAFQLTRNRADAEDLLQDATVKAWRAFETYTAGRPFLNWFLRIMQRAYLDIRRRDNPIRRADSLNSMISPADGEVQELPIPDPSPGPDAEAIHAELRLEIARALAKLPDMYRDVIQLCDLEERSYAEIAELEGTSVGTVRSRIHRGRKMLREVLRESQTAMETISLL